MSTAANVGSLDAVARLRGALLAFLQGSGDALTAAQLELARAVEWVEHDRPKFWEMQLRRSFDAVAEARAALERKRIVKVGGETPSAHEEQIALEKAKRRLRHCEEMQDAVRNWQRTIQHEIKEFSARLGQLNGWLETDGPRAVAALERMLTALESYVSMAPPTDPHAVTTVASMARDADEDTVVATHNPPSSSPGPPPPTPDARWRPHHRHVQAPPLVRHAPRDQFGGFRAVGRRHGAGLRGTLPSRP